MQNSFSIQVEGESTLNELINILEGTLCLIKTLDIDKDQVIYLNDDVGATIDAILGYISERMPGRFKITHPTAKRYTIQYIPPDAGKDSK